MFRLTSGTARCAARRAVQTPIKRRYATKYEERRDKTLKTSSRLTWMVVPAAAAAGLAYQYYDFNSTSSWPAPNGHVKTQHEKHSDLEAPKPVEDRHGDTVEKHSIAAHKNQNKVREGVFKGGEFDNHLQKHSPGNPGADFEKK